MIACRFVRRAVLRLALGLGVTSAALVATEEGALAEPSRAMLDERRVVESALRTHPAIRAATASRDAAEANASAANRARIPELTLSGRYARLSSIAERYRTFGDVPFPQFLDSYGGRASVGIALSDTFLSLAATARAAGRSAEAAAIEVVTQRAETAYEARVAFYDYWSKSLALRNASELLRAAEQNAIDQRHREGAGTVSHNDVLSFESALDAAAMGLDRAKADLAAAEATLRIYLPDLHDEALDVPPLPLGADAPLPVPTSIAMPPRLASLAVGVEGANERVDAASWDRLPKLKLYGNFDVAAPNPRIFVLTRLVALPSWEAGIQVEWSLSQLSVGGARTEEARAQHAALVARLDEAKRKLEAERQGTRGLLAAAQSRVERAKSRVEHAAALANARRGELDAGTALPLAVVVAETDLARAKNEWVDAFVERALAIAKLDFIEGRTGLQGGAR